MRSEKNWPQPVGPGTASVDYGPHEIDDRHRFVLDGSRGANLASVRTDRYWLVGFRCRPCNAPKDNRMPRPRERVCLQDGLKLYLNRLARNGFIRRGSRSGP